MRLDYQDSIDRYLLNRMSDKERKSFEAKCAEAPELKNQLEHTRKVRMAISARSRILEQVQKWDEEYEAEEQAAKGKTAEEKSIKVVMDKTAKIAELKATKFTEEKDERKNARKKRLYVYWLSGIAAVFVIGFFLYPTLLPKPEESGNLVSMNQDDITMPHSHSTVNGTIESPGRKEEQENLLAKNDVEKKETKESKMKVEKETMSPLNQEHVFSFGKEDIVKASPSDKDESMKDLKKVEEEIQELIEKTKQNDQQYASGAIDQDIYETMAKLLKYQTDQLLWRKAKILHELNRTAEAITILDEIRKTKGLFQNRADSLYKELTK